MEEVSSWVAILGGAGGIMLTIISMIFARMSEARKRERMDREREEKLFEQIRGEISKRFHELRNEIQGGLGRLDNEIKHVAAALHTHEVYDANTYVPRVDVKQDMIGLRGDINNLSGKVDAFLMGSNK